MRNEDGYMFWGGEYSRTLNLPATRRSMDVRAAQRVSGIDKGGALGPSAAVGGGSALFGLSSRDEQDPIQFEFSARSGLAMHSR